MKIGVISDCFKKDTESAIRLASQMGFHGIQIYATTGEFSPEVLTEEDVARYNGLLLELGLEISALCGDMGGHGFEIAKDNPERIEKTKAIIDLATKLGTKVVTTHIGVIPEDTECEKYKVMLDALKACGEYAES